MLHAATALEFGCIHCPFVSCLLQAATSGLRSLLAVLPDAPLFPCADPLVRPQAGCAVLGLSAQSLPCFPSVLPLGAVVGTISSEGDVVRAICELQSCVSDQVYEVIDGHSDNTHTVHVHRMHPVSASRRAIWDKYWAQRRNCDEYSAMKWPAWSTCIRRAGPTMAWLWACHQVHAVRSEYTECT